MIEIKIIMQ